MDGNGWFWANLFLFLVVFAHITVATEEVKAHVGSTVDLPCRVDTSQCGDLHSVKWYRETSRIYVFSQVGKIQRAEGDAFERMKVKYEEKSTEALLEILHVEIQDEASYKCEITYLEVRENCDVVQIIKLTTLVKPEAVRIWSGGEPMQNMQNDSYLGPKDEGTEMTLICEALNGKPTPEVTWYNGTEIMKGAEYKPQNNGDGLGTGISKVQITLTRGDLGATYRCEVKSDALEEPIVSWIKADVNVRPTRMELSGVKSHVVQGTNVLLICNVFGARPAAEVRWFNNTDPITDEDLIQTSFEAKKDGTFTTESSLIFRASRWENGQAFHCSAENEVMRNQKETSMDEVLLLEVLYPPVVSVAPPNITTNETGDILLLCTYFANPQRLEGVVWTKNDRNLTVNPNKYEGGTIENPPLIIKNVSREDMGEYTCICKNNVGSQQSENSIYLDVHYPPNVEVKMEPSVPVKAKDRGNVTLECSIITGNPSVLQKVRWFLGDELMKELPECNYTSFDEDGNGEGSGGPLCGIDPSILSLERVEESFAGNYTCQGKNIAGWGVISEPRELIVYFPPSPANLRYSPSKVVKKASVTLFCSVDHPGRPDNVTYIWYRGNHLVHEITRPEWRITPVTLETKSNFTCMAANEGGISENATVFVNVSAPPGFIQNLPPYLGVLVSSANYSLTCRVECSPPCSINWFRDGKQIHFETNPLYTVQNLLLPPDLQKNDFESIQSTLIWNIPSWPGGQLDRTAPNSYYTCQSHDNNVGPGVNSTVEIAVDYPPENLTVSNRVISVVENKTPEPVKCSGKGHPALSYVWKKNGTTEPLSKKEVLQLYPLSRAASGTYICEASNKHGAITTSVIFNVQYSPECSISITEVDGNSALVCTARANPSEVSFTWRIREANDTPEAVSIFQEGTKSFLILDSSVDTFRTYLCYANNSVGISSPCERDVAAYQEQSSQIGIPGNVPWWKRLDKDNLLIIIAIIVGVIVCVIIICIIIILLCRRKRASNKYNNPLEMEEREKPDGQSPDTSGQSRWPLKPGVLVHVNKMHNLNMSQLSPMSLNANQFKTTSVSKTSSLLKYKRNKNKVYARLERLKSLLGFRDQDQVPIGITAGAGGVVTFRKFNTSTPTKPEIVTNSRKRKKPGLAPNQSSTGDKTGLGGAPPGGGSADPLTDPDKGFYENLPFHGMQNPPNKPVSRIAPFMQGNAQSPTTKSSLISSDKTTSLNSKAIKRNQSFHGFQNNQNAHYENHNFHANLGLSHMYSNPQISNFGSTWSNCPQNFNSFNNQFVPSIFYNLPANFAHCSGNNTVSGIRSDIQPNFNLNRFQSTGNLTQNMYFNQNQQFLPNYNPFSTRNPFSIHPAQQPRVMGRKELPIEIRRTASGINPPLVAPPPPPVSFASVTQKQAKIHEQSAKPKQISEKRFGSLEIKKHKCYSPTFYSMRCKKHAKKRPILYALPKKTKTLSTNGSQEINNSQNENFENLTDSIQISEENSENKLDDLPKPAPRCKVVKKTEIVYANVSKVNSDISNSSNDSFENNCPEISVTEALIHHKGTDDIDGTAETTNTENKNCNIKHQVSSNNVDSEKPANENPSLTSTDVKNSPKQNQFIKKSPTVKISPSFKISSSENPKNSLPVQIQIKTKFTPTQTPPTSNLNSLDDEQIKENFPLVPKMPILNTENKWSCQLPSTNQNAFYTLTTPHYKHSGIPQQYSATIPHQKHIKLMPRTLFQDQQLPKSKSFSSKSKQKKHFQIPLQKCHSFRFQTAESYFQPIKNIHEENLMRNGYVSDLGQNYPAVQPSRSHKREKHKKGPLVVRRPSDYQENVQFQENVQNSVQLQYPQPLLGRNLHTNTTNKPNGVVYADLDMPKTNSKNVQQSGCSSLSKSQKAKPKTEYATLKFNDIGQEIDV